MHPIDVLPDIALQNAGPFSKIFLGRGLATMQAACRYVKAMPYGSNRDSSCSQLLFEEGRGTCSTKHGAIAHLAQEHSLPIYKNLGFYRLNDTIVTGVSDILAAHELTFIPQIHCFLEYESYRIDLTEGNCNGKNQTIDDYDFVVRVEPDPSFEAKQNCYLTHLRRYFDFSPALKAVGEKNVLEILEKCDRQVNYQCSLMAEKLATA
ncbi:MAG: hypothetical protein AAFY33_00890 [Cyanobacteria bacterium J06643_4]